LLPTSSRYLILPGITTRIGDGQNRSTPLQPGGLILQELAPDVRGRKLRLHLPQLGDVEDNLGLQVVDFLGLGHHLQGLFPLLLDRRQRNADLQAAVGRVRVAAEVGAAEAQATAQRDVLQCPGDGIGLGVGLGDAPLRLDDRVRAADEGQNGVVVPSGRHERQ